MNHGAPLITDKRIALPPTRTPASAWYGLIVLLAATLLAYTDRQMLSLVAPALESSLGLTDLQIGVLQGLGMAIFACVASYPLGWLADRFGRRRVLAAGVTCWSAATLCCALQSTFQGLFLSTIGIAVGEAGLAPVVFAMIPDLFPERRRNIANFIFYAGSLMGAGAGMAAGGAMLHGLSAAREGMPHWLAGVDSWRIAMTAAALPGALLALLVATMPLRRRRVDRPAAGDEARSGFIAYARAHWQTLACVYGSLLATGVAMNASLIWFPLALPRAFGVDPTGVGVGLGAAIAIATVVGVALPACILGGRHRAIRALALARIFVALTPAPAVFLPLVASPLQAYVLAAVQGALGIASSSLIPGLLQDLAPPHLRSRILALLGIANGLALAVSPMAIGAISSRLPGPRGVINAITLVSLPSLLASAFLIALAARPYAATVAAVQAESSEAAA